MQRLYFQNGLFSGQSLAGTPAQNNYLRNVLRLGIDDELLVFNGIDGEWRARIECIERKSCLLKVQEQTRTQPPGADLHYLFAPLKKARLDYMVQKATEMGAGILQPVITEFTVARRINMERMRANAIEAAEQCNILQIPQIMEAVRLDDALKERRDERKLVFCDEAAPSLNPLDILKSLRGQPLAVLIGPEGGFSPSERKKLLAGENIIAISLGPRIMRADTAAVAAMALIQAAAGDWN